ncbi:MAG: type II toxin-antitoxin system HicB family antitoxin [Bdellovibrionales bacterium]|jgi:predicted RNase H-like HicB family nuclease|nr:type II toxin-antitoxin system HicB family antitoxin [Bdellovibrionales bacterium]MBT3525039.1 type II toxin-antitoxin system HicB family antitoxin [Bdellovibrionales bacterium]MBT7668565.1 type II toxin-antitoxin system HicB family antitoxin [Bdellovibrionales bacterium]MBT7766306.1 type II toxin-antitoxin system HicB family antitoxin [Bdellovibrionales bacterium]
MIRNSHLLQAYLSDIIDADRGQVALRTDLAGEDSSFFETTAYANYHIYYAHFQRQQEGAYLVTFPEFEGCQVQGESFETARCRAAEELGGQLRYHLQRGQELPDTIPRIGKDFHPIKILI